MRRYLDVLENAVGEHGIRDLDEAADIRALDVVDEVALSSVFDTGAVNILHDLEKLLVDLLA